MEPDKKENEALDLDKILLPKKESRTSASAERVNAGVLLEQEAHATLKPETEAPKAPPPPPPPKKPESDPIAPLQTYQSDIESVIEQKNISAVSIATAEAERRGAMAGAPVVAAKKLGNLLLSKGVYVLGGVTLIGLAVAVLLFVLFRPTPSVVIPVAQDSPLVEVDDTRILLLNENQWNRTTVMQSLEDIRSKTSISLGLIGRSYVVVGSSTEFSDVPPQVSARDLLSLLAPNTGDELRRTLDRDEYVLGTHVFDGNQSFFIFRIDSYEQAFSGMLAWERTMRQELLPLFGREPRPRTAEELSSSTPQVQLLQTPFVDRIVENHDARVVENEYGDILLLWTFLNRSTLVITTNDATLRELISRYNSFTPEN